LKKKKKKKGGEGYAATYSSLVAEEGKEDWERKKGGKRQISPEKKNLKKGRGK